MHFRLLFPTFLYLALCSTSSVAAQTQQQAAITRAADDSFWEALKDGDIADCDKYLRKYPNGRHASEARRRKEALAPPPVKPSTTSSTTGGAYRDCPECPLMMPVEGGTYTMGDANGEDYECPHQVTVSAFSLGVYEVTVEEYLRFADATNSHYPVWLEEGNSYNVETGSLTDYKDLGYSRNAKTLPVCGVSWDDAVAYCQWLSRKTGKKYRLPLEKEWEYAAKAGKKTRNYEYAGSNEIESVGWYYMNAGGRPHAVGEKTANELGLFDMSGNLWEWCQDKWGPYPGCTVPYEDSDLHIIRGGSWFSYAYGSSHRVGNSTTGQDEKRGFRCARDRR